MLKSVSNEQAFHLSLKVLSSAMIKRRIMNIWYFISTFMKKKLNYIYFKSNKIKILFTCKSSQNLQHVSLATNMWRHRGINKL